MILRSSPGFVNPVFAGPGRLDHFVFFRFHAFRVNGLGLYFLLSRIALRIFAAVPGGSYQCFGFVAQSFGLFDAIRFGRSGASPKSRSLANLLIA